MKKNDSFRLTEKQLEQIKQIEQIEKRRTLRKRIFIALLFITSCVSGFLVGSMPNETLEMVCTGICGLSGLGSVIMFFVGENSTAGGSFNPEFEKELEEARTETGYFGKQK